MYRIAILEDEGDFMERLKESCRRILNGLKAQYAITGYSTCAALLEAVNQNPDIDFFMLDILMEGETGLDAARKIRARGLSVPLVFITKSRDFALEGYEVKATHYMLKPDYEARLETLLREDYVNRYQQQYFIFENGSDKSRVCLCHITHMEITGRKVQIYLPGRQVTQGGKLTDLLERLPRGWFVRCHQGYAVNMQHVDMLRHREVVLDNGLRLPVGRTFYMEIRRAYVNWFLGTGDSNA